MTVTYLRAEKNDEQPPAYVKVNGSDVVEIMYPSGEATRGVAASILFSNDLKPVCEFTNVDIEETPFESDERGR